jgi:hypothetical protein
MMKTLIVAATATALAAPVFAQVPPPSPALPNTTLPSTTLPSTSLDQKTDLKANVKVDAFVKADGDKNGALSIAEVKLADASVTQADFDKYDADKSKSLSKVEFAQWASAKAGAKASAPGQ